MNLMMNSVYIQKNQNQLKTCIIILNRSRTYQIKTPVKVITFKQVTKTVKQFSK